MLSRRDVLKQFLLVSAGTMLIPSCLQEKNKATVALKNIRISGDQEKMLADFTETLLPRTDTPGAKDLAAHLFVLRMVDDCYSKANQQKFIKGLEDFERFVTTKYQQSFSDCSNATKNEIFKSLESKKGDSQDREFFYFSVKHLTIEAYTTSQFYLTKIHIYKLVPGHFQGCVPVSQADS